MRKIAIVVLGVLALQVEEIKSTQSGAQAQPTNETNETQPRLQPSRTREIGWKAK